MQQRKYFIRFLGFALLIIIPITLSIATRKQLGEDAYLRAVNEMNSFFSHSMFGVKEYDLTFFLGIAADVHKLVLLHSVICIWGGMILVCDGVEVKNQKMYPLVISYSVLALISLHALLSELFSFVIPSSLHIQLSRLAFNIHVFRGVGTYIVYAGMVLSYFYFVVSELKQPNHTTKPAESNTR